MNRVRACSGVSLTCPRRPPPPSGTYHGDHAGRLDAVAAADSHQTLVVRVLAPPHQHLVTPEVGLLVDHEEAALHPAGVAPAQEGGQLGAVAAGLVGPALEVAVLVEDDLWKRRTVRRGHEGETTARAELSLTLPMVMVSAG